MGIQKTHIGFHKTDGGVIYRVGGVNALISYFYCDYCKASSSKQNLSYNDIVSDTSALIGERK